MSNWKINGTDLTDYGVYVQSSSGILDSPQWQDRNDGTDWIDEHFREYWQSTTDIKYKDREILLNCWISAASYTDFITQLSTFYTLVELRNFTLTTPLGDITGCYVTNGFNTIRKTNYKLSNQVGAFNLRITVAGDNQQDTVYYYSDSGGVSYKGLFLSSNLKVYKRLRSEMYATCTAESTDILDITRYDFIVVPVSGRTYTQYEKFYLVTDPEVRKVATNKYVYNLRFEHISYLIKHVAFRSLIAPTSEEGDFYWFADLEEVVDKIIANCNATLSFTITKGTVDATIKKNHKFSGESCWDVLQMISETYEKEWDFTSVLDIMTLTVSLTLDVKDRIERNWPYTLQYGQGNGLYELTRDSFNKDELCTVLYAWGSEKNLKADYLYRRLKCPVMPLVAATGAYGIVEKTVFFEDEYPAFDCTVSDYYQVLPVAGEPVYESIKEQWPDGMYRITADATLTFDPTDSHHLIGLPPKVAMRSGDLAGFEFEIKRYDATGNYIYIKPSVDEYAGTYPSATIYPAASAEFTLIDIAQDSAYVTTAEASLYAAALSYINEYSTPKLTYRVTVDAAFINTIDISTTGEYAGFNIGDTIGVIDTDLGMNDLFRVSDLTKDCYTGRFELTLSEKEILTNREQTKLSISNLEKQQKAVKSNESETLINNQETTAELRRRLFEESDRKLAVDYLIRDESLDPRMLSFDAGVPQFMVNGCLIETNYNNLENRVKIGAGTVDILNWPDSTLDRYMIKKKIDAGEVYDPRRSWTMPEIIIDLPDSARYYAIIKLPRDDGQTAGSWYCTGEYVYPKIDSDYIQYTEAYINPPTSKRQAATLWGNRKIHELPNGGASGEILMKRSSGDGDAVWTQYSDSQNAFSIVAVSGQSDIEADNNSDTLNIATADNHLVITTNEATDTVTFQVIHNIAINPTGIEFGSTTQQYDVDGTTYVSAVTGGTLGGIPDETLVGHKLADCLTSISISRDNKYLAVQEKSGAASATNPLTVQFIFTGVTSFDTIEVRSRYIGTPAHTVTIQLWNWTTGVFDSYVSFSNESDYISRTIHIFSPMLYIGTGGNIGKVILQYIHQSAGTATHYILFDYVTINDGGGGGGSTIASGIPFTPYGNISSTNVQAAIQELDDEVDIYPDTMTFDNDTRTLTLTRTGGMSDLTAVIPDATGGGSGLSSYPIEFGFNDVEAGTARSWDLDINVEFPYQIKHSWLRTNTGTLSGVNVAIDGSPVSGLDNITVTSSKAKSTAASGNEVAGDETVTLNITTAFSGAPEYIGGHIYIEMV